MYIYIYIVIAIVIYTYAYVQFKKLHNHIQNNIKMYEKWHNQKRSLEMKFVSTFRKQ